MTDIANGAFYWSSSPRPSYAYNSYDLGFNYNGYVDPNQINGRSNGFSLRCVQE